MAENHYLQEIESVLPRLLALFDTDRSNKSFGMGDRYYWAWGLIDFGNGTFQGASHGLARLWRHGMWPYPTPRQQFLERIDSLFSGAKALTRRDGSLEEAFPNEGSYCVTALVAFDLLCTIDLLNNELDEPTRSRWLAIIHPMIAYLVKSDETHALISNHLATAVAALTRWHSLSGDVQAEDKAHKLLQRILDNQSNEGWLKEYEGADPGYQSLCIYYLADVHQCRPDWGLREPLRRCIQFLWHFAHPDGSFGGLYGSRCTRFYYPAGLEALSNEITEAASLAIFMRESIQRHAVVTLSTMDEPNLVPMFNAWCWAATLYSRPINQQLHLPCQSSIGRVDFTEAGLIIDGGPNHYTIINTHKGGVVIHFRDGKLMLINSGVLVKHPNGKLGSTQTFTPENEVTPDENGLTIRASLSPMPKQIPTPRQFLALRMLCLTVFHIPVLRERIKQLLVHLLITRRPRWPATNMRCIRLGPDISINDVLSMPKGYSQIIDLGPFIPIHMASQGYWQIQDEGTAP
ncbi:hypothetical protein [Paralcaligenes ginsengisoli]